MVHTLSSDRRKCEPAGALQMKAREWFSATADNAEQDHHDAQNAAATCGVCGFRPSAAAAPPISEDASSSGNSQQAATWLARDTQTLRRVARALKLPGGPLTPGSCPQSAVLLGPLRKNHKKQFFPASANEAQEPASEMRLIA